MNNLLNKRDENKYLVISSLVKWMNVILFQKLDGLEEEYKFDIGPVRRLMRHWVPRASSTKHLPPRSSPIDSSPNASPHPGPFWVFQSPQFSKFQNIVIEGLGLWEQKLVYVSGKVGFFFKLYPLDVSNLFVLGRLCTSSAAGVECFLWSRWFSFHNRHSYGPSPFRGRNISLDFGLYWLQKTNKRH